MISFDKFWYSHLSIARYCKDIIGRSFRLITSGRNKVKCCKLEISICGPPIQVCGDRGQQEQGEESFGGGKG